MNAPLTPGQMLNDALQGSTRWHHNKLTDPSVTRPWMNEPPVRITPTDPCTLFYYVSGTLTEAGSYAFPDDAKAVSDVGRWIPLGDDGFRSEDSRTLILRNRCLSTFTRIVTNDQLAEKYVRNQLAEETEGAL